MQHELLSGGWRVAIVWECALRKLDLVPEVTKCVEEWLKSDDPFLELGEANF